MGKHPAYVKGYKGSIEELANAVENMSYDEQINFFNYYIKAHEKRVKTDEKDKPKLAKNLYQLINSLKEDKKILRDIWDICKPRTTKIYRTIN